jgi:hypothetical protein
MTDATMSTTTTIAEDWASQSGRQARLRRERRAAESAADVRELWEARQRWARDLPSWWPALGDAMHAAVTAWAEASGIAITYTVSGGRGGSPFTRVLCGSRFGTFSCSLIAADLDLPALDVARVVERRADHAAPVTLDAPVTPEAMARQLLEPWLADIATAALAEEVHQS